MGAVVVVVVVMLFVLQSSHCSTVVVDEVTQWKHPTSASIGDTIIFKHKNEYNLYIFRTKQTYNSCNFTQAVPLSNLNSTATFTWHPSRIGSYYFGFYNNTNIPCEQGQKLTIKVSTSLAAAAPTPGPAAAPAPAPAPTEKSETPGIQPPRETPGEGGTVSSSPAYPWPNQPREKEEGASPGPTYTNVGISPMGARSPVMGSMPFINSNPAVPLPTGEVDSTTFRPLPTPAHPLSSQGVKIAAFLECGLSICYVIIVMFMII